MNKFDNFAEVWSQIVIKNYHGLYQKRQKLMHFSFEIDIEDPHELRPLSELYKICIFETYSSKRQAPHCQNFLNMSINKQNVSF